MPVRARLFTISGFDANGHRRLDDSDTYSGALTFKASMERIGWRDIKVYDVNLREVRPDEVEGSGISLAH
jgi:hypothetical protein